MAKRITRDENGMPTMEYRGCTLRVVPEVAGGGFYSGALGFPRRTGLFSGRADCHNTRGKGPGPTEDLPRWASHGRKTPAKGLLAAKHGVDSMWRGYKRGY